MGICLSSIYIGVLLFIPAGLNDMLAITLKKEKILPTYKIGKTFWGSVNYSHSIVPGGLEVMSYTTRFTCGTSAMMREEILRRTG